MLENWTPGELERTSKAAMALAQAMTVNISLVTLENPERLGGVQPEKMAALSRSRRPIENLKIERRVKTAYLGISDLTARRAETYGLDLPKWKRVVENASNEDYANLSRFGSKLRDILRNGSEAHIKAANGTDLRLELVGRPPRLNDGI
ncbi:MAG TPA: hypothetical protein VFE96_05525, partial [Candidatus Bathyarchaeia archaeon]|nr:hypothetical protein [Candidatus Bathyarchaeia archaeon]